MQYTEGGVRISIIVRIRVNIMVRIRVWLGLGLVILFGLPLVYTHLVVLDLLRDMIDFSIASHDEAGKSDVYKQQNNIEANYVTIYY